MGTNQGFGYVGVREESSALDVDRVSKLVFPDGSLTAIGADEVQVALDLPGEEVDASYASLSAAVTAIGATVTTLKISTPNFPNGSTTTVPATLTLEFIGNGSLLMDTGETVTILSDGSDWPIKKLFYNATAGQGTISFAGNASIPAYYAEWFGALGDNLTASAAGNVLAWNALFLAVPNGSVIKVPTGAIYRVSTTLHFDNKQAVTLTGGIEKSAGVAPCFRWTGTGSKLLTVSEGFLNAVLGITFDLASGATVDKFIESDFLTSFNGGHFFKGLYLNASSQANASFIGIDIDPSGAANNENFVIEDVLINCSSDRAFVRGSDDGVMASGSTTLTSATAVFAVGDVGKVIRVGKAGAAGITLVTTIATRVSGTEVTLTSGNASGVAVARARIHTGTGLGTGIRNGNNPNVKHNVVRNIGIHNGAIGIDIVNGSMLIYNYGGGYCLTGLKIQASTETIVVHQMVTEGNVVEIEIGSSAINSPIHLTDLRCSNEAQLTEGFFKLDGFVTIDASSTGLPPPGGRVFSLAGSGNLDLTLNAFKFHDNNRSHSLSESGFDTFNGRRLVTNNIIGLAGWPAQSALLLIETNSHNAVASTLHNLVTVGTVPADSMADSAVRLEAVTGKDTRKYGDGEIEIYGVPRPNSPGIQPVGTHGGSALYVLSVVSVNSLGNRSLRSYPANLGSVANTLSASNYLHVTWPAVPNVSTYELYRGNPVNSGEGVLVASGIATNSYDIVANPGTGYSAWTALIPAWNQSTGIKVRAPLLMVNEVTFASTDATPSVALGNDFLTANASATTITHFDDFQLGQLIRVRVNDANTTFGHGSGIITRTGANVVATNGLIYQFIRRGSDWYQL